MEAFCTPDFEEYACFWQLLNLYMESSNHVSPLFSLPILYIFSVTIIDGFFMENKFPLLV